MVAALSEIRYLGCSFIVGGRKGSDGRFETLEDVLDGKGLPESVRCESIYCSTGCITVLHFTLLHGVPGVPYFSWREAGFLSLICAVLPAESGDCEWF